MRILLVAILALLPLPVFAQAGSDATEDVTRLSRHVAEMRELMSSRDTNIREAAIERGLADPSSAIRGMAVFYALRRYDPLPLHFALPEGSSVAAEDLPSVTFGRIKWSDDGKSFTAAGTSCGAYSVTVSAQVTADRLRLQFGRVCFGAGIRGSAPGGGNRERSARFSKCEAELTPNKARDAMEGKLHCPGLQDNLPLSLPLG